MGSRRFSARWLEASQRSWGKKMPLICNNKITRGEAAGKAAALSLAVVAALFAPISRQSYAQAALPSTESFQNAVYACALDSNIKLTPEARDKIRSFYEGVAK